MTPNTVDRRAAMSPAIARTKVPIPCAQVDQGARGELRWVLKPGMVVFKCGALLPLRRRAQTRPQGASSVFVATLASDVGRNLESISTDFHAAPAPRSLLARLMKM